MRDLCERPGIKYKSLPLSVNWGNAGVHAVFDASLLLHDYGMKKMTAFVYIFMRIFWPDVCVRYSCIRKSIFYCAVYCLGLENIVEIMGHIYKIIIIGFPNIYATATNLLLLVILSIV